MKKITALLAVSAIILAGCSSEPPVDENTTNEEYIKGMSGQAANQLCQQEVKKELISPDSAEFKNFLDVKILQSDDKTQWFVMQEVDSQNAFGAMVHNTTNCVVTPSDPDNATVKVTIL